MYKSIKGKYHIIERGEYIQTLIWFGWSEHPYDGWYVFVWEETNVRQFHKPTNVEQQHALSRTVWEVDLVRDNFTARQLDSCSENIQLARFFLLISPFNVICPCMYVTTCMD